jgi:hypothetical protein
MIVSCVRQVQQNDGAISAVMFLCSAERRFARHDYPPFFSVHGYHEIVPQWQDDTRLSIGVPRNETIYIQEQPSVVAVAYTE